MDCSRPQKVRRSSRRFKCTRGISLLVLLEISAVFFVCICAMNGCQAFITVKASVANQYRRSLPQAYVLSPNAKNVRRLAKAGGEDKTEDDDSDTKDNNLLTFEELARDPELWEKQQQASNKVLNSIMLPDRIGKALNTTAWLFLRVGFLLNVFGYGYVKNSDGWITIDTLENKAFQMELSKKNKLDTTATSRYSSSMRYDNMNYNKMKKTTAIIEGEHT